MGTYTQRKRFEDQGSAEETAANFHGPGFHVPGVNLETWIVADDSGCWLYVRQTGDRITADTPSDPGAILPDYELFEVGA